MHGLRTTHSDVAVSAYRAAHTRGSKSKDIVCPLFADPFYGARNEPKSLI